MELFETLQRLVVSSSSNKMEGTVSGERRTFNDHYCCCLIIISGLGMAFFFSRDFRCPCFSSTKDGYLRLQSLCNERK